MKNKIISLSFIILAFMIAQSDLKAAAETVRPPIKPIRAGGNYEQFAEFPDLVLATIAQNLSDKALANFGKTSRRMGKIARDESAHRPGGMWASKEIVKKEFKAHAGPVTSVYVAQNGDIISVGKDDKPIKVWDGQIFEEIRHIDDNHKPSGVSAFSPTSNFLAIDHRNSTIGIWNVITGEQINYFDVGKMFFATFSPNGQTLAACKYDYIYLWDVQTGKVRAITPQMSGIDDSISNLAFSPDGKIVAIALYGYGPVILFDVKELKKINEYSSRMNVKLLFLPDDKLIGSAILTGSIAIYDIRNNKMIAEFMLPPTDYVALYTISADGAYIACATQAKMIIWNFITRRQVLNADIKGGVTSLTFSDDNTMLVAGRKDGSIMVWKVKLGQ